MTRRHLRKEQFAERGLLPFAGEAAHPVAEQLSGRPSESEHGEVDFQIVLPVRDFDRLGEILDTVTQRSSGEDYPWRVWIGLGGGVAEVRETAAGADPD